MVFKRYSDIAGAYKVSDVNIQYIEVDENDQFFQFFSKCFLLLSNDKDTYQLAKIVILYLKKESSFNVFLRLFFLRSEERELWKIARVSETYTSLPKDDRMKTERLNVGERPKREKEN